MRLQDEVAGTAAVGPDDKPGPNECAACPGQANDAGGIIEISGNGGKIARSAGTNAQLVAKDKDYCQVKLSSGEVRYIRSDCMATIGQVGNVERENIRLGKAGRKRWLGRRPIVRGVAMNPIDHPLGGGEGKSSGGRAPVTPWGKPEGKKTRKNKRTDKFIIKKRK